MPYKYMIGLIFCQLDRKTIVRQLFYMREEPYQIGEGQGALYPHPDLLPKERASCDNPDESEFNAPMTTMFVFLKIGSRFV
jgi:hypothetical protein